MTELVTVDLINRIASGDSASFKTIVAAYQNLVYSVALKVMGNQKDAEDAVQETFVKVFKGLKSFRLESKFSTWIYRIAYNTCLDISNLRHNKTAWDDIDDVTWKISDDGVERGSSQYDLDAAISELPLKYRQIIVLFYYNQFSYKEIADIISESEGNVKTLLYRARQHLKHFLETTEVDS